MYYNISVIQWSIIMEWMTLSDKKATLKEFLSKYNH